MITRGIKKEFKNCLEFFYDAKYHTKISLFSSQAQQDPLSPLLLFLLFFWSSNAVSCFDNWVITTSHCTTFNPLSMAFFHTCQHSQKESSHTYQSFYFSNFAIILSWMFPPCLPPSWLSKDNLMVGSSTILFWGVGYWNTIYLCLFSVGYLRKREKLKKKWEFLVWG